MRAGMRRFQGLRLPVIQLQVQWRKLPVGTSPTIDLFSRSGGTGAPYPAAGPERDNCELSEKDSRELDVNNPAYFEISGDYDYFERSPGRQGQGECLDGTHKNE